MPHAAIRLKPTVNTNQTPALNEAGISASNLIRFFPDRDVGAIPGKLGGWTKFFPQPMTAITRALWAWRDSESVSHLAVGAQKVSGTEEAYLGVITDGVLDDITPRQITDNITPDFSTTAGDSIVTITDTTTQDITFYDTVYIPTHVSVGGLILFGLYAANPDGSSGTTTYTIEAKDKLGNPLPAPSTDSPGAVAQFDATSGSPIIEVTLPDHGFQVGDVFPILIPVTVGGVTLYNLFNVVSVIDADTFTIIGPNQADSNDTVDMNDGNVRFMYSLGLGPIPPGSGFGVGPFGAGGFGVGSGITPSTGTAVRADDWSLANWGSVLLATPNTSPVSYTTTGATGGGVTGTVTFSSTYETPIGNQVTISGAVPTNWNGTYFVTASAPGSVSFLTAETGPLTTQGTITIETVGFQPVYQWDTETGYPIASPIAAAPPISDSIFVAMPQRQIIALGTTFTGVPDPLLIRWCDVNNFNTWIGQTINQAGSYRLARGSKIIGGMQASQQGFVWTDIGLWSMQYIGQPYVYSFNEIGSGCGLIGRKAMGILGDVVYWMGPSQFFRLGDGGVEQLPCDVWDAVFQNMNTELPNLIRCAPNARFNEVSWYYASVGSTEVDSYVKMTLTNGGLSWDYGSLGRSAWIDQSVLGPPIGTDPVSQLIYQHETSTDADGSALLASFRTGYFELGDGDRLSFVDQLWPDMKFGYFDQDQNATVKMTFYGVDYPGQAPVAYGPFTVTQSTTFVTPRLRHRLMAFQIDSDDTGSWWRLGLPRYRYAPDGRF